ncbi:MAG TPA: LytTR family DNA-binding domain-containing protein [Thermoanaerobaculia bacterium]|nr:LytTR family DNA-binding domain-containing protein [Thermoanaerobaculia bacterium]
MIRALIVDDEPLARARVAMLLAKHEDVEVIGEAGDGDSARRTIAAQHPDLVLLDVQMPGMTGLELLQSLPDEGRPAVVFLTAYDEYAIDAFDAAAVDYVRKPVDPKRLARALDRVRGQRNAAPPAASYPDRFLVRKSHGRRVIVKTVDIEWIGAERNYIRLYTHDGSHLMREAISRIEEQLDPKRYARIHRSAIVNLEFVKELATDADGSLFVTMRSAQRLSVGDSYRDAFEQLLGRAL